MLGNLRCADACHDENVDRLPYQFRGKLREPLALPFRESIHQDEVLSLPVAELAQTSTERIVGGSDGRGRARGEDSDPGDLRCLLRPGCGREEENAEGEGDDQGDPPLCYLTSCRSNSYPHRCLRRLLAVFTKHPTSMFSGPVPKQ